MRPTPCSNRPCTDSPSSLFFFFDDDDDAPEEEKEPELAKKGGDMFGGFGGFGAKPAPEPEPVAAFEPEPV